MLEAIADRIENNADEFARLESLDNGKPITEARIDIELVVDHFRYFAGIARAHEGRTVDTDDSRHVQTIEEPYGVVGQIIPWNFPLLMAAWKLGPALSAGNTVVLKPAEETPLSVLKLMEEADDVIPDGVVNIVTGFGPDAGEPLSNHSGIRKLAFTGSTEIGSKVMKAPPTTSPTSRSNWVAKPARRVPRCGLRAGSPDHDHRHLLQYRRVLLCGFTTLCPRRHQR